MNEQYLYGAAVQGIQSFIFQTNKLREIVGASELVEEICTIKFYEILSGKKNVDSKTASEELINDNNCILHAAGNIKYIFENGDECKKIVKEFPKAIFEFAPGVTVSQAVVKMEGKYAEFKDAVNELEKRLRTQRNKPMRSATLGLMGIERSRQTGLPIVDQRKVKGEWMHVDAGTRAKLDMFKHADEPDFELTRTLCNTAFGKEKLRSRQIAYDIEKMTHNNDWIAIIHADGNGLGQVVQAIGTDEKQFKKFSESLDKATKEAAIETYKAVKERFDEDVFIPIRPIVLGGDDFTTICRADIALEYVTEFIKQFEEKTVFIEEYDKLKFNNLTACAGIAYIKSSYPFYYGYNLAESLCSEAKKDAKANIADGELAKSCLMFHKVQDSFTEDWSEIAKRELTPQDNISFQFGPYYINEKKEDSRWTVKDLVDDVEKLGGKEGNAVKSHLRQWMSLLHDNPEMANQKLMRLESMTSMRQYVERVTKGVKKEVKKDGEDKEITIYPVYDILAIHTINTQTTKEEKL